VSQIQFRDSFHKVNDLRVPRDSQAKYNVKTFLIDVLLGVVSNQTPFYELDTAKMTAENLRHVNSFTYCFIKNANRITDKKLDMNLILF